MHSAALFLVMVTRRTGTDSRMSTKASKTVVRQMVKSIVDARSEHKIGTVALAAAAVTTAGTVDKITQDISQGSNINNRDGDTIRIEDLTLCYNVRDSNLTIGNVNNVRVIVFADTMNTGLIPSVTDVLNTAAFTSGYNTVNRQKGRFKIYHDQIISYVSGTSSANQTIERKFKVNRNCFYSNNANNSTDNGKGALFVLHVAANVGGGFAVYQWAWELKYTDL